MKLKIFLFWLVATAIAPIVLQIPVVGNYIVLITVVGPIVLLLGYVLNHWVEHGPPPPSYTRYDIDKARDEGHSEGHAAGYHEGRNHGPY
jgi:hypothetical protein